MNYMWIRKIAQVPGAVQSWWVTAGTCRKMVKLDSLTKTHVMKICIWKQGLHILYAVGSKSHLPSAAVNVAWTYIQNQYHQESYSRTLQILLLLPREMHSLHRNVHFNEWHSPWLFLAKQLVKMIISEKQYWCFIMKTI